MDKGKLERFPTLRELEEDSLKLIEDASRIVNLPAGAKAFEAGMQCDNYLMVMSGCIRVQQVSQNGHEIVLYRVGDGETCVLTTACLLAHEAYSAEAIAETDVSGLMIPRKDFDRLMAISPRFREFVFTSYGSRITDLMVLVEEIAFGHIDIRLAQRLLKLTGTSDTVALTHQELANELGTAREVISRQLKEFENRNWIQLGRGQIKILNREALSALIKHT